ncbi:MAG: zinc ribbon domain-containing protein, partial [Defluviitaleaceae bacterium]|nr:zinc ribbon domain-containing protein [Defluviitaleaceae bacterium]
MSDLKSKIMNFGKSAAKTSGNLISQAKINLSLSNEESKVNAVYMDMGKKVAEIYSYGANIGDYFDEKYAELLAIKARIAALRQELDTIKGVRKCQKCGKSAPATAEFCPKCGEATGIVGHIEHSEYAENPETPDYAD